MTTSIPPYIPTTYLLLSFPTRHPVVNRFHPRVQLVVFFDHPLCFAEEFEGRWGVISCGWEFICFGLIFCWSRIYSMNEVRGVSCRWCGCWRVLGVCSTDTVGQNKDNSGFWVVTNQSIIWKFQLQFRSLRAWSPCSQQEHGHTV